MQGRQFGPVGWWHPHRIHVQITGGTTVDDAIERVILTMRRRLGEPMTVDDLARTARFSKFHFTRIFQRATGVSPGRFLSAMRLNEAKRLLITTSRSSS